MWYRFETDLSGEDRRYLSLGVLSNGRAALLLDELRDSLAGHGLLGGLLLLLGGLGVGGRFQEFLQE